MYDIQDNAEAGDPKRSGYPVEIGLLTNLRVLKVTGLNGQVKPGQEFSALNNLKTLEFSSKDCSLQKLGDDFFVNLQNAPLEKLSLRQCKIFDINNNTLLPLTHLKTFDLSCNPQLGTNVTKAATGLRNAANLTTVVMNYITKGDLSFVLDNNTFGHEVVTSRLKYLSLENNNITEIKKSVLEHSMTYLEYLSVAGSKSKKSLIVGDISVIKAIIFHKTLKSIDISYISRYYDKDPHCDQPSDLYTLEGDIIPKYENCTKKYVDEHESGIQKFQITSIENIYMHHNGPNFRGAIHNLGLFPNNLRMIDASNDHYRHLFGPLTGLNCIEKVDLSDNPLEFISEDVFHEMPSLKHITLRNCSINQILQEKYRWKGFFNLSSLEYLDLSWNNISTFKGDEMTNMTGVKVLNFSHNSISSWGYDLSYLHSLEILDLSHNKFSHIPDVHIKELHKIADERKPDESYIYINISHNAWECNHAMTIEAFKRSTIGKILTCTSLKVADLENLTCRNASKQDMKVSNILILLHQNDITVSMDCFEPREKINWVIYVVIGASAVTALVVLILAVIFGKKKIIQILKSKERYGEIDNTVI